MHINVTFYSCYKNDWFFYYFFISNVVIFLYIFLETRVRIMYSLRIVKYNYKFKVTLAIVYSVVFKFLFYTEFIML